MIAIKTSVYILLALLVIFGGIIVWQMNSYKVSEPPYVILKSDGHITIRQYPAITVAEVNLNGERYEAINSGFRLLANYIFGGNKENTQIAMTAPVIQTPETTDNNTKNKWIIKFVMPANYDKTKLPKPNNPQVNISTIPEKKYIVIRFSGFNTEANLNNHLTELKNYAAKNSLITSGNPIFAFYNPPWILPFLRRNEIMLTLEKYP